MEMIAVNKKVFSGAVDQLHQYLHDVIDKKISEGDFINQIANFVYIINDSSSPSEKMFSH